MPEEKKLRPSEKQVDLDTSGPEVDVTLEDTKEEYVQLILLQKPRNKK